MIAEYNVNLENKTKSELILFIKELQDMLKEKDKEIERLRYIKKSFDYVVQKETEKKNRQIDLMARAIDNYDSQLEINTFRDKEHVKQYFKEIAERKSKEC